MYMNKFRTLRADEIDCRVSQVKANGVVLLLYKDARCDQNILDETVGPDNWQRHHSRDNANCTVSIWSDLRQQWIEKEDVGTESRTEREKGLASDSFKRACFNWGIGRELYTAPFIFVQAANCNIRDGKCFDNFTVDTIEYQPDGAREIRHLIIRNEKTGKICYQWQTGERRVATDFEPAAAQPPIQTTPASVTPYSPAEARGAQHKELLTQYAKLAYSETPIKKLGALLKARNITSLEQLTDVVYEDIKGQISADIAAGVSKKGAA